MSTRWYPRYCLGNPQLRVFLPNFFMKLVKPPEPQPRNVVTFHVSMEMTKFDVKNYLEKIYGVPVANVVTHVKMGKIVQSEFGGHLVKKDDHKVAYVSLPESEKFEFPNLYPESKEEELEKQMEQLKVLETEWDRNTKRHKHRPGLPSWFGV